VPSSSPFEQILGADFAQLPEPVRRLHSLHGDANTAGRAEITTARGFLPWLICRLSGLPAPGNDVEVTVSFHIDGRGGEFWRRRFAGRRYASSFEVGRGRHAGLLRERLFPLVFFHRLTASPAGLRWEVVGWRLLSLPLPRWTRPRAICFEGGDGDRFTFDIDAAFPLVGPVIHYRGWLLQER